jgi:hypothetical protein
MRPLVQIWDARWCKNSVHILGATNLAERGIWTVGARAGTTNGRLRRRRDGRRAWTYMRADGHPHSLIGHADAPHEGPDAQARAAKARGQPRPS